MNRMLMTALVVGSFGAWGIDAGAAVLPGGAVPGTGLAATAAEASVRGCDILDPAHCMMPFPSDHFTTTAAPGSIQSAARGGTGKRIDINILGMPRNVAGKPVDPTEWNRNDGFSPGQMIVTVVPGLAFDADTGAVAGAPPITDIRASLFDPDASVMVIDADTGTRHPVWAEMDLNAGFFLPSEGIEDPNPEPPALIIRPARNFQEGHRYIVVLRNMRNDAGKPIPANPAFAACRDGGGDLVLPQVAERCAELERNVFAPLAAISAANPLVDVPRDDSLFLAWDFTVASQQSLTGRLLAMRDDAFASLDGAAPGFTVDKVTQNPNDLVARRIEGTFTVPSYLVPPDASPLGESQEFQQLLAQLEANYPDVFAQLKGQCGDIAPVGEVCDIFDPAGAARLAATFNLPPNRLYYDPTDGVGNPPYGDGLPDRSGTLSVPYICNVPRAALGQGDNGQPVLKQPARPSLYGHGLLGSRSEVNNTSHVATMGDAHDIMYCATDWYGFSEGDLPNVLSTLLDLSLFPVVPDASQQGMLNFMFLARLLKHPQGFASDPAFQVDGRPVFDTDAVFYDGNSQGGILGGVVVATSPDIDRGVLGVPGMNYSTLLRRSKDFDLYSIPLYLAYQDSLDRTFLLSFMEMAWERAENNGYAAHLNHDPLAGLDGEPMPVKRILLHPAFGDHQVTMWSADVMARTMRAAADGSRTDRHPDTVPFALLDPIEPLYETDPSTGVRRFDGSALVIWDEPWTGVVADRCVGQHTPVPPTGNVPPRAGDDPHECPRREVAAQCQKSHFLREDGAVIDVTDVDSREDCPAPDGHGRGGAPDSVPPDVANHGRGTS